jgi:HK97 family phage prohead protease
MTVTDIDVEQVVGAELEGLQYRAAPLDGFDLDERIITLTAVPYGIEARLAEHLVEVFDPSAFARAAKDPSRCKLWFGHSTEGGRIVGQGIEVTDLPGGLQVRARVSQVAAGDELLTLAKDGVLDEASIEFMPIKEALTITKRGTDMLVRHRRAHLRGVALVPAGAYGRGAVVTSVRDDSDKVREEWLARLRARTA